MRLWKYKVTPSLILIILVILFTVMHGLSLLIEVLKNNSGEKVKTEKIAPPVV